MTYFLTFMLFQYGLGVKFMGFEIGQLEFEILGLLLTDCDFRHGS